MRRDEARVRAHLALAEADIATATAGDHALQAAHLHQFCKASERYFEYSEPFASACSAAANTAATAAKKAAALVAAPDVDFAGLSKLVKQRRCRGS